MNSRRCAPRTAKRTWAKLSETQRSVLEAAEPYNQDGSGTHFESSELRTARSLVDRGLLIEHGNRHFARTAYAERVIDWKDSNEHR